MTEVKHSRYQEQSSLAVHDLKFHHFLILNGTRNPEGHKHHPHSHLYVHLICPNLELLLIFPPLQSLPHYCILALVPIKTLSSKSHILRYPSIITKSHSLTGEKNREANIKVRPFPIILYFGHKFKIACAFVQCRSKRVHGFLPWNNRQLHPSPTDHTNIHSKKETLSLQDMLFCG